MHPTEVRWKTPASHPSRVILIEDNQLAGYDSRQHEFGARSESKNRRKKPKKDFSGLTPADCLPISYHLAGIIEDFLSESSLQHLFAAIGEILRGHSIASDSAPVRRLELLT